MANQDDLALLMTTEQGKPLAEAKGEIAYGAVLHRVVRRGGASASTATPSRRHAADQRIVVIKQPIGVVRRDHAVELSRPR